MDRLLEMSAQELSRLEVMQRLSKKHMSQFGRAMQELDIQIICANSPQAKGRVERVIQTLQDRLPKELRLRGISNMTEGNAYLPEFLADLNQRFAVEARSTVDAHRTLTAKHDLARILTWQEIRSRSSLAQRLCHAPLQTQKVCHQGLRENEFDITGPISEICNIFTSKVSCHQIR